MGGESGTKQRFYVNRLMRVPSRDELVSRNLAGKKGRQVFSANPQSTTARDSSNGGVTRRQSVERSCLNFHVENASKLLAIGRHTANALTRRNNLRETQEPEIETQDLHICNMSSRSHVRAAGFLSAASA